MDPMACLKAFDEAKNNGDRATLAEHADAMVEWLKKDGFLPWKMYTKADWRSGLTRRQLIAYFIDMSSVVSVR